MMSQGECLNIPMIKIMLVANAGISIEYNGQQILIDALHAGHRLFPATPPEAIRQLLDGLPPFESVKALLFTHNHIDHFSAPLALQVLQRYPEMSFISDQPSAASLLDLSHSERAGLDSSRIQAIPWFEADVFRTRVGEFSIEGLSFEHEGSRFAEIPNIGYLVTIKGRTILFPGDARMAPGNFEQLASFQQPIDTAVVMFPYISTGRGQTLIREVIKPRRLIVVHWPDPSRDSQQFTDSAKRYFAKTKDQLMETFFLEKYEDSVEF